MNQLTISEAPLTILAIQDEIRRSEDARYDHRLHAILLVAKGEKCQEVAELLGDSVRAVQYWVNNFEEDGFAGLQDKKRPGRPPRLNIEQLKEIDTALRATPETYGLTGQIWDGKTLSEFIYRTFGITLGVRQCQRLFRQLKYRLKKPKSMIAGGDPVAKDEYKKTQAI